MIILLLKRMASSTKMFFFINTSENASKFCALKLSIRRFYLERALISRPLFEKISCAFYTFSLKLYQHFIYWKKSYQLKEVQVLGILVYKTVHLNPLKWKTLESCRLQNENSYCNSNDCSRVAHSNRKLYIVAQT